MEAEIQMYQTEILQLKGQYQKLLETINELTIKRDEKLQAFELIKNPEESEKKLTDIIEKRKTTIKKNFNTI